MENLTIKEFKELSNLFSNKREKEFEVGKNYFLRTVTYSYVGKLIKEGERFLKFINMSWIADTGRFNECMKGKIYESTSSEIEPYPLEKEVFIGIDTIVDIVEWSFDLPTKLRSEIACQQQY